MTFFSRIATARQLFLNDSLFRNATYLMASTAVMSVLGFVFWIFVAHLYKPADIGIASALISISTLISNLSLLGLNSGIIRFLAGSKKPSQDINAAALTVAGITIFAAAVYALFGAHLGGNIDLLQSNWHKLAFIALMGAVSLNSLTDAVFIANRRGEYHTIGYATFGIVKLILPLALIPFGALGIFAAYILAMLASLIVSLYLMWRGCGYRPFTKPEWSLIKEMRKYTFHNYIGVVVAGIPAQLIPLLIMKTLGAASVAYFSMAWTMVNLLYIVPSAITQSLLAESSFATHKKTELLKRTIKLLILILVPAVMLAVIISPYLLSIFGNQYRQNGTLIFQILSFATFFLAITAVGNTMLNIERRTWGIVAVQLTTLISTGIAALYLVHFGLAGIGIAFLIGNVAASITLALLWIRRPRTRLDPTPPPTDEVIRRILEQGYGIRDFSSKPLGNGSGNYTLLISTAAQKYVLRIYRPAHIPAADIEQEVHFMRYLALHHVPTPWVTPTSAGETFGSLVCENVQRQFLLMQYVEGYHPTTCSQKILKSMANQQALLHLEGIKYAQQDKHRLRHENWSLRLRQRLLSAVAPAGFSHFDYDTTNLLVNHNQVSCIIDFEGMRYGPLVTCVYFTLSQLYARYKDAKILRNYVVAYEQTRKLTFSEMLILQVALTLRYKHFALLDLRST